MTWYYEVRGSNNKLVASKGGFATEQEAVAAGGDYAKRLRTSAGYPGGTEVYTVMAGQREESSTSNQESFLRELQQKRELVAGRLAKLDPSKKEYAWEKEQLDDLNKAIKKLCSEMPPTENNTRFS